MKTRCDCDGALCARWHPRIKNAMTKAASKARTNKKTLNITIAGLAQELGCSRPTLYKHGPFIEDTLRHLEIERRRVDGTATRVALEEKNERISSDRDAALEQVAALQLCLAKVYQTLALNGAPVAALVEANLRDHGVESGACPLCGSEGANIPVPHRNVVPLRTRKDPR